MSNLENSSLQNKLISKEVGCQGSNKSTTRWYG